MFQVRKEEEEEVEAKGEEENEAVETKLGKKAVEDPLVQVFLQAAKKNAVPSERKKIIRVKRKRTAAQAEIFAVSDKKRTKLTELFSAFSFEKPKIQNTKVYRLVDPKSRDYRDMDDFLSGADRKADRMAERQKERDKRREDLRKSKYDKRDQKSGSADIDQFGDDIDVIDAMVKGDQLVQLDGMEDDVDEDGYEYDYYEEIGYNTQSFDVSCPVFYLVDPERKNWDVEYDFEDDSYDSQDSNHEDYYTNDYPDEDYFRDGDEDYDYDIST